MSLRNERKIELIGRLVASATASKFIDETVEVDKEKRLAFVRIAEICRSFIHTDENAAKSTTSDSNGFSMDSKSTLTDAKGIPMDVKTFASDKPEE